MIVDALSRTFVFIEVNGESFDFWTDYTVTSDLLHGAGSFSLHCADLPRTSKNTNEFDARGLKQGAEYLMYLKTARAERPVLVDSGRLDDVDIAESRNAGTKISATGRGHLAKIIDSDVLPSLGLEGMTLDAVAMKLLTERVSGQPTPFYTRKQISIDNDANRALTTGKPAAGATLSKDAPINLDEFKIDQIKPHAGETVFDYLTRHARRFGLLVWGTADGRVVFGRPEYEQKPLYPLSLYVDDRSVANNCDLRRRRSFKHRASEVHVYGHSSGGDFSRTPTHAVVYDDELRDAGIFRALTIHDPHARSDREAKERAQYELSVRKQTGDVLVASVAGHADDGGAVYAIDTIARVDWANGDLHEERYVVARTFHGSMSGTSTTIDLVPKYSIALGGPA